MPKVFFDTSVLFSAIYSQTGGSYQICRLVKKGEIEGYTTETVIKELQNNILKFSQKTKKNLESFIANHKFIVRSEITERETRPYLKIIVDKDAHVLAEATLCKCDYLLTLDKKHLNNEQIKERFTKAIITSPKKFLEYFRK